MILKRIDGNRAVIDAASAAAPGSRLKGTTDAGLAIQLKVHRCVRDGDRFVIEGRFIDLTREVREALIERLAHSAGLLLS